MIKSPLKIRGLRVRAVNVPMTQPHRTASGTIAESPLVLTDVLTDEDVVGHSYVFCYGSYALKPTALLIKALEPFIVGQPLAPFEIERLLAARFRLLGPQGLTGIATAAIDMALWDALARSQYLPLVRLLGAAPKAIPAYGAAGYDGPTGQPASQPNGWNADSRASKRKSAIPAFARTSKSCARCGASSATASH